MFVVCALIFVLVAVDLIAALWTRSPGRAALDVGSMVFCYWLAVGALAVALPRTSPRQLNSDCVQIVDRRAPDQRRVGSDALPRDRRDRVRHR